MGIDPGTNFMGYAIIKVFGKNQKPELKLQTLISNFSGYSAVPYK